MESRRISLVPNVSGMTQRVVFKDSASEVGESNELADEFNRDSQEIVSFGIFQCLSQYIL